jgi:protein-S-isoprenylcysteine O-methyltransferase Ste14
VQSSRYHVDGRDRFVGWILLFVQLALLAAVFLLPEGNRWTTPAWLSDGARAFSIFGVVVVGIGLVNLGRSATPLPTPVGDGELHSDGLYRYVRHPIYSGLMALAIGSAIPSGSIAVAAAASALVAWLALKARWEERLLRARYSGYSAYASRTPRFIPSWRRTDQRGPRTSGTGSRA